MNAIRTVEVGGAQPYRIAIGPGLLDDGATLAAHVRGRHVLVVSDTHVAPLYAQRVAAALQEQSAQAQVMVDGEGVEDMVHILAGEDASVDRVRQRDRHGNRVAFDLVLDDFR